MKTYLKENKMYARILDIAEYMDCHYSVIEWHLKNLIASGKVEKVRRGIYKAI
jgi:predicted transcriptional regulator